MKKILVHNKKARHNYTLENEIEAGISLQGSEIKSLRKGMGSLTEAYALVEEAEVFLVNCFIPPYTQASYLNHEPRRRRKLLLKKQQINRFAQSVKKKGATIVPLNIALNSKGYAKVYLALGYGKTNPDKRLDVKEREWGRQKERVLKNMS